jgi:hypothetical protein
MTEPEASQQVEVRRLASEVFLHVAPSQEPAIVILTGGPGSAPARTVARLVAEYDDQIGVVDSGELAALASDADNALNICVQLALRSRRSLVVCPSTPDLPAETLDSFAKAGFGTRIVSVSSRETESLLSVVSAQLRGAEIPSLGDVKSFDKSWSAARLFVETAAAAANVGRVTVMDGGGNVMSDGPGDGAVRAFDEARLLPMSNLQSVAWLGELRRLAEYAESGVRGGLSTSVHDGLVQLHDLALERVVPNLPIRQDGPVAAAQRASLLDHRSRLEHLSSHARMYRASPTVPPALDRHGRGL